MSASARVLPFLFLAAACGTTHGVADLAKNEELYRPVAFQTKLPGDRTVFVAPVVDARRVDVLPAAMNGYPITYDNESRWERPIVQMVDDVLREEIARSGLFTEIVTQPAKADVILEPRVETFLTAQMELEHGARAIGEIALLVRAHGPVGADGQRTLVHEEIYGDRQMTPPGMRTISRHFLAGSTLRASVLRLLNGLDGSNVGRAGMPVAPLEVVEQQPDDRSPAAPASGDATRSN